MRWCFQDVQQGDGNVNPAFCIVLGLRFVFPYWLFFIFTWTVTADQPMNRDRTQYIVYAQY